MSLSVLDVRSAVTGFQDSDEAWYSFYDAVRHSSVELSIGTAEFESENEAEPDSYGDYFDAEIDFVFSVAGQYFRKHGYYDSYEGRTWNGVLEEVKPRPVAKTVWERV